MGVQRAATGVEIPKLGIGVAGRHGMVRAANHFCPGASGDTPFSRVVNDTWRPGMVDVGPAASRQKGAPSTVQRDANSPDTTPAGSIRVRDVAQSRDTGSSGATSASREKVSEN